MKIKSIIALLPLSLLLSCGESEDSESGTEGSENTGEFHTSFGTCAAGTSKIALTSNGIDDNYISALKGTENLDWGSFTHTNAELTKDHGNLYIKFANSADALTKSLGSFTLTEQTLTITVQNKDGELEAGEYSEDDLKVKLTFGRNDGEASQTSDVGSDKLTNKVILNDISENHVCGSFSITTEEGQEIVSASFDLDVKLVNF